MSLKAGIIVSVLLVIQIATPNYAEEDVRHIVVWDERQPKQKLMYENFLGNHIADSLRKQPGFSVRSVGLDDAKQGLADEILEKCDVLIWWGHVRQGEISIATARGLVKRIQAGQLSLIVLHSAHWSATSSSPSSRNARETRRTSSRLGWRSRYRLQHSRIRSGWRRCHRRTPSRARSGLAALYWRHCSRMRGPFAA